jgi:hypothetical protein
MVRIRQSSPTTSMVKVPPTTPATPGQKAGQAENDRKQPAHVDSQGGDHFEIVDAGPDGDPEIGFFVGKATGQRR